MSNTRNLEIWLLVDDKAGHRSQVVGVANALGQQYTLKTLKYNRMAKLPNLVKLASLMGIDKTASDNISPPWPDIVIAAGRRTAPVARYIKKQAKRAGKKCFAVQIMWPGFPAHGFDLIAVPEHDSINERGDVIKTVGAPHPITTEKLNAEAEIWKRTLANPPKPCVALMVGGSTGKKSFTANHAVELARLVSNTVNDLKGSLLISTSRRTPPEVIKALKENLTCGNYFHEWEEKKANPYYAFIGFADAIIVTGDSISMCSEACAAGKPVYIYAPDDIMPKKHKHMHESLYEKGFAIRFNEHEARNMKKLIGKFVPPTGNSLDTARHIAEEIKKRAL